jgi:hypothetical protein
MISVGILANDPVWEEYLSVFSQGGPFRITGRTEDHSLNILMQKECITNSDVIWIPELTPHSMEAAIFSLRQSRHVLLGFPVVDFQGTVDQMVSLSREANVDVQVGHHDRYHPAFRAVLDCIKTPQFIRLKHQQKNLLLGSDEQELMHHI